MTGWEKQYGGVESAIENIVDSGPQESKLVCGSEDREEWISSQIIQNIP